MLATSNCIPIPNIFENLCRRFCSVTFLGTEVRLTGLYFPGFSFLPTMRTGVTFAPFPSSRTSPNQHDLSRVVESALAMASVGSLSTPASVACVLPFSDTFICLTQLFLTCFCLMHYYAILWEREYCLNRLRMNRWRFKGKIRKSLEKNLAHICISIHCLIRMTTFLITIWIELTDH